jgi:hypothetical protein
MTQNQSTSAHLIRLTEAFARASGRKPNAILGVAAGYHGLYTRLKEGRSCTIRIYERAMMWFANNWPDGAKWPTSVPCPSHKKAIG